MLILRPKEQDFSLFHLNIASISKHNEEQETILTMIDYKFHIMGISETKIFKSSAAIIDINMVIIIFQLLEKLVKEVP